jgi:tetratricopeptide (TPR) repeat protein
MMTQADAFKDEGLKLYRAGDYAEAAAKFEAARQAFAAAGGRGMAAEMLNNAGLCRRGLKQWNEAQATLEAALAEFRALEDRSREAQALGNLAAVAEARGDLARASALYEEAAELFKQTGDEENRSLTLKALGTLQLKRGRHFEALAHMDAGLAAAPRLSLRQRALRWLISVPMRMIGGR